MKKKKTDEQSLIKRLKSDSDKFVLQARETDVAEMRSLVVKASSLKKTAEEKELVMPHQLKEWM